MNRRDFLHQLKSDLWETVREAVSPLIADDLRRLETWADAYGGFVFHRLAEAETEAEENGAAGQYAEKRIGNAPILLFRDGGGALHAYSGKCPACGMLLHVLAHRSAFRCFSCETEIGFAERDRLTAYPLKRKEGAVYVGIPQER